MRQLFFYGVICYGCVGTGCPGRPRLAVGEEGAVEWGEHSRYFVRTPLGPPCSLPPRQFLLKSTERWRVGEGRVRRYMSGVPQPGRRRRDWPGGSKRVGLSLGKARQSSDQ